MRNTMPWPKIAHDVYLRTATCTTNHLQINKANTLVIIVGKQWIQRVALSPFQVLPSSNGHYGFPGRVKECLRYVEGWLLLCRRSYGRHKKKREPSETSWSSVTRYQRLYCSSLALGGSETPYIHYSYIGARSESVKIRLCPASCFFGVNRKRRCCLGYQGVRKDTVYKRVHKVQATVVKTKDKWHKANVNEIAKTPKAIHLTLKV